GFIGEFLILSGAFRSDWRYGAIAVTGVILGAAYLIWLFQRVMFGPLDNPKNKVLHDLDRRELAICVSLTVVIFWTGLFPGPFLRIMEGSVAFVTRRTEMAGLEPLEKKMLAKNETSIALSIEGLDKSLERENP
ncbi:hypothetical protein JYT87_04050, partial [Nitrospira defluvii]|nr:hypothetical protein [Nitrospira defluvii]